MTDMPYQSQPPTQMAPAPIGTRFVAIIIDWLVIMAMFIPVFIVAFILGQISGILGGLVGFIGYLAVFALSIYITMWQLGETGQTPGKRSQGVMVLSTETGGTIGGGMGIARYFLGSIINSFCFADIIFALIDSDNQRLSDKLLKVNAYQVQPGEIMPIFPDGKPF